MHSAVGGLFRGTKRFKVEGQLGEGGMGVVHRVRDVQRGEVVALKTISRLDAAAVLRFKREFRALADISHPNVVQLYELFSEEDQWFFTMELVDGCDLLTWVSSSLTVPAPESAQPYRSVVGAPTTPVNELVTMVAPKEIYDTLVPATVPPTGSPSGSPGGPATR